MGVLAAPDKTARRLRSRLSRSGTAIRESVRPRGGPAPDCADALWLSEPHQPNRPQPIHARSKSIDTTQAFAKAFLAGQRGIVVMKTFNEGVEIGYRTEQWTIDPLDGVLRGIAFVWDRFDIPRMPAPMLACCMCTVPASALVRSIMPKEPDPRMPAILADVDWPIWLGEIGAEPDAVKSVLRTVEGVNWQIRRQAKKPRPARPEHPAQPEPELF